MGAMGKVSVVSTRDDRQIRESTWRLLLCSLFNPMSLPLSRLKLADNLPSMDRYDGLMIDHGGSVSGINQIPA
jgi:hypothetical protein